MGYMTVETNSPTLLHLKRSPGIRSWSLLVGKFVLVFFFDQVIQLTSLKPTSTLEFPFKFLFRIPNLSLCRYSLCRAGGCVLQLGYGNSTQLSHVCPKQQLTAHRCSLLCVSQTASRGSSSTSQAACLWPFRTWRTGRRPCSTRPGNW